MKNLLSKLSLFLLVFTIITSCNQTPESQFTLTGTLEGYKDGKVIIEPTRGSTEFEPVTAVVEDYKKLSIFSGGKKVYKIKHNKGHKQELCEFFLAIEKGNKMPISFDDIYWSTKITFDVIKSIREGKTINYQ